MLLLLVAGGGGLAGSGVDGGLIRVRAQFYIQTIILKRIIFHKAVGILRRLDLPLTINSPFTSVYKSQAGVHHHRSSSQSSSVSVGNSSVGWVRVRQLMYLDSPL
ncbi:hypothetical protein L1987_10936 [Smallanthus sonchifolius]|uniref:Uncharacterized protein n=1 Tax=Smallanthus sonchifolius TaxID=185202 RepID=A0ACB9J9W6_9ASTR|nr:hypothetical protein L1987_10936 [Smallanthus sonchifolius]